MITADELRVFLHDSGLDADIFNQAFANLDQGAAEVEAQLLLLEFIRIVNTNHQKHHTAKAVKPTELRGTSFIKRRDSHLYTAT